MLDKLKLFTKTNFITILIVLILVSLFYWFQIRPLQIRKSCEWNIFSKETAIYQGSRAVRQNNAYRQCLVKKGLQPESLFVNTE